MIDPAHTTFYFERSPFNITGCIFSSLLSAYFEHIKPMVGIVDENSPLQHYQALTQLGFTGANLHCEEYVLPTELIRRFQLSY